MQQLNLTEGVLWRTLVRFSMPLALSSLLQSICSVVDLIIAGHYVGKVALSAISNASQITMLLTQIIIGVTMGANVLIGQYYGSRDSKNRKKTNVTLFSMAVLFGLFMMVLLLLFGKQILILIKAPAIEEAATYLRICALGLAPVFGYNALSAMIRGVGNSKQPLYFILIGTIVNIVCDILFIGYFHMGVAGAAWATILAQTICFLAALGYTLWQRELYGIHLKSLSIEKDKLMTILRLGIPSAVQMTLVGLSWLTMTFFINRYGVEASAASGINVKIKDFAQLFTTAMITATSTMVAQCLGARRFDRAKQAVYAAMKITLGVSALLVLLIQLLAPQLVSLFGPDQETAHWAVLNLRIEIFAQIFYAIFMMYNALAIGAGHTMFVLLNSIANSIVARLILAAIFDAYVGLVGIYWACLIAPVISIPIGYLYERSNIWRRSLVEADSRKNE